MATVIQSTATESPFAAVQIVPSAPYIVRVAGRTVGTVRYSDAGAFSGWTYTVGPDGLGQFGAWATRELAESALLRDTVATLYGIIDDLSSVDE